MVLLWIVVALVFAIVEVATVSLYAGFVSIGAVFAAVVAVFAPGREIAQVLVFALASLVGVLALRPYLMRRLRHPVPASTLSGAQTMLGAVAVIVKRVGTGQQPGHARIFGENWPALAADGAPIELGAEVRIVELRGATLIVEPVGERGFPGAPPDPETSGPA